MGTALVPPHASKLLFLVIYLCLRIANCVNKIGKAALGLNIPTEEAQLKATSPVALGFASHPN